MGKEGRVTAPGAAQSLASPWKDTSTVGRFRFFGLARTPASFGFLLDVAEDDVAYAPGSWKSSSETPAACPGHYVTEIFDHLIPLKPTAP